MSSEKRYFWLKLHNDFFGSKRIKKLRKLGADFVIIYLKMQLLALKSNGFLEYTGIEDSFADELALDIDEDTDKVQLTLSFLQACDLLEVRGKNDFFLPYVEKNTGSETKWAEQKRNQKLLPKLENGCRRLSHEMLLLPNGKKHYVDEKRYGGNGMLCIDRAGAKCEICGSDESILIHHANEYSNEIDDLYCLCPSCHSRIHRGGNPPRLVHSFAGNFPVNLLQDSGKFPADIEIEKEIELDIDIEKEKSIKTTRHKYGQYNNVLLSDEEMEKLKTEFPDDYNDRIERLSSYIASTGKKYKNFLATIRNWARNDKPKKEVKIDDNRGYTMADLIGY